MDKLCCNISKENGKGNNKEDDKVNNKGDDKGNDDKGDDKVDDKGDDKVDDKGNDKRDDKGDPKWGDTSMFAALDIGCAYHYYMFSIKNHQRKVLNCYCDICCVFSNCLTQLLARLL